MPSLWRFARRDGEAKMIRWLRQQFCLHWFDNLGISEHEYNEGIIVCGERRLFRQMIETRVCARCGLVDKRAVGEPVYLGWD